MALRIAFVGAGGIANAHLNNLQALKERGAAAVEIAALCDVRREVAEEKAVKFGGAVYTDWATMLAEVPLDALFICTPPFAHGDLELAALDKGLPLFVEKPIALNVAMAKPILQAIEQAGVVTAVAYKYRWDDHVQQARALLADKTLGLVVGRFWTGMPGAPWWRVQAESGGQMVEQTTHIVDMARYLCGEIVQVAACETRQAMHTHAPDCDIADAAAAALCFESGAVGTITNTFMIAGGGTSGLDIMGDGYRLSVEGDLVRWWGKDESGEITKTVNGYEAEAAGFLRAVETGDRSAIFSDYADAYRSLAVTEAINLSGQRGGAAVQVAELL